MKTTTLEMPGQPASPGPVPALLPSLPIAPRIKDVTILCVPGGRFVEIEHAAGHASLMVEPGLTDTAALLAESDALARKAERLTRWASLYRATAEHLIREKGGQP